MRKTILACATLALILPAAAQARDCKADGTLVVDDASIGTQAVTRDPLSPESQWVTYLAVIRNASAANATFTVRFTHPSLQRSMTEGRTWVLLPGQRTTVIIGNAGRSSLTAAGIRDFVVLTCN